MYKVVNNLKSSNKNKHVLVSLFRNDRGTMSRFNIVILFCTILCSCLGSDVVVDSNFGQIRGQSADGVNSFLGIPYAQPPVGSLR